MIGVKIAAKLGEESESDGEDWIKSKDEREMVKRDEREDTGPDDVSLTITYYGICYADVAWAKNIPRNTIYPGHANIIKFEKKFTAMLTHTFNSVDEDDTITRGGYAFKIPDNYLLISAAPLLCAGITVYAPIMHHKMNEPGKSLGVIGLGGLGHLAVRFGKAFGLHSSARSLDFIIDTASGDDPFDPYIALLKPSSRAISGSVAGGTKDMQEMLDFYAANNIRPEVEVILIQYVNEVLKRMENRDVKYLFVIDIKNSLK
ncbi:hypothetical protein GIB67_006322 [Kingdonia uniflora]|uniref:Uncharacterized protein n=1 Tax=Kingdonia uniflora TaxID=39325 RepID=A0A7J7P5Q0_9MAGN|nr:hypothetical protein GIB67_006322 [Kingdonia uniflora]